MRQKESKKGKNIWKMKRMDTVGEIIRKKSKITSSNFRNLFKHFTHYELDIIKEK